MSRRHLAVVFVGVRVKFWEGLRDYAQMLASDDVTAKTGRRKTRAGPALLLALLLASGCAGMEPYEPRNNREEGPEKGLFTGEEGEFVIFRLRSKPKGEEGPQGGDEERQTQEEESETQNSQ